MSNYLNYYEIQHTNTDFENLIHYLQDAVKENKLKITKEVVDNIIEITNKQELFEAELEKSYDAGYSDGYKDGYDHARRKWEPKIDNDDLPFG